MVCPLGSAEQAEPDAPSRQRPNLGPAPRFPDEGALPVEPIHDDVHVVLARRAGNAAMANGLETEFGEHAGGRLVVAEMCRRKRRQPRIGKTVPYHRTTGLGRVALTPPGFSEPEAELGDAAGLAVKADATDQPALQFDSKT